MPTRVRRYVTIFCVETRHKRIFTAILHAIPTIHNILRLRKTLAQIAAEILEEIAADSWNQLLKKLSFHYFQKQILQILHLPVAVVPNLSCHKIEQKPNDDHQAHHQEISKKRLF